MRRCAARSAIRRAGGGSRRCCSCRSTTSRIKATARSAASRRCRSSRCSCASAAPYLQQWGALALHVVPWLGTDRLTFHDALDGDRRDVRAPDRIPAACAPTSMRDTSWGHVARRPRRRRRLPLAHAGRALGTGQRPDPGRTAPRRSTWADVALVGRDAREARRRSVRGEARVARRALRLDRRVGDRSAARDRAAADARRSTLRADARPISPAADTRPTSIRRTAIRRSKSSYFDQAALGVRRAAGARGDRVADRVLRVRAEPGRRGAGSTRGGEFRPARSRRARAHVRAVAREAARVLDLSREPRARAQLRRRGARQVRGRAVVRDGGYTLSKSQRNDDRRGDRPRRGARSSSTSATT